MVMVAACGADSPTVGAGSAPPPDTLALAPPPVDYDAWWRATEACAGVRGEISAVRWFVIDQDRFSVDGTWFNAFWFAAGNIIVLARPYVYDGPVVRHEMLHALLRRGDHPAAYFRGRCARVVRCAQECQRD